MHQRSLSINKSKKASKKLNNSKDFLNFETMPLRISNLKDVVDAFLKGLSEQKDEGTYRMLCDLAIVCTRIWEV